jgi:hypothetical protein
MGKQTSYRLTKSYPRLWSLDAGVAMVVTDLHGDWDAYRRYRDRFVNLQAKGRADFLIFAGDLVHQDDPTIPDHSLKILMDVLELRAAYGVAVIYLCGNHELPHIYGFGLSKGGTEYTPAFEAALSQSSRRSIVIDLLHSLPFYVRTAAGVSLAHAGASAPMTEMESASALYTWNHRQRLLKASTSLANTDVAGLRRAYARLSGAESYDTLARHYLSVTGPDDPRYDDLLRGFFATTDDDFRWLHSALLTKCEHEYGAAEYAKVLATTLQQLSIDHTSQQVLVAGHMTVPGGYQVIARRHLRLASASHATPREAGLYLLFDTARPIDGIDGLLSGFHSVYDRIQ